MEEYFDPRGGSNRHKVNLDFFKTWSNEMAYVLGFLYADGDIVDASHSARTQYIKFASKDRSIIEKIKMIMEAEHAICCRPPRETVFPDGKVYRSSESFYLRIGSRKMFADLKRIGLTPNKSKTVKLPKILPDEYLRHFIRGYFDGDGCVCFRKMKGKIKKLIVKKLTVIFTCGSRTFLEELDNALCRVVGFSRKNIYESKRAYQSHYGTADSVELFKFLYQDVTQNVYLKRKFDVFTRYFQLRPDRVDKKVEAILNN